VKKWKNSSEITYTTNSPRQYPKRLIPPSERKRQMLDSFLPFNPNARPPHLSIKRHVLETLKLSPVLPDYLTTILLRPPSTSSHNRQSQPLKPPNWIILASHPHVPERSNHRFPHFVIYGSNAQLLLNIFNSNLIQPSVPTHPSEHPHLSYFHLLDMGIIHWPTLYAIIYGQSCHLSIELALKFQWHIIVTQYCRR